MEVVDSLVEYAGSLLLVVVAVRLSLWNFYSQKWWERKADTYSTILESLAAIVTHGIVATEVVLTAETPEGVADAMKSPVGRRLAERRNESEARIEHLTTMGTFVVSEDVAKHLNSLRQERSEIVRGLSEDSVEDQRTFLINDGRAVDKAINAIRECGQRELRPRWWQLLSR